MKEHPNFYENIDEAVKRLRGTTVLYDGEPYYVYNIGSGTDDGIFRAYLYPIGGDPSKQKYFPNVETQGIQHNSAQLGPVIDAWMKTKTGIESGMIRKHLNSPKFNKFRPYPLGMCNYGTKAFYVERQPNRKTEQGLIRTMLDVTLVSVAGVDDNKANYYEIDMFHPAFRDCVLNAHPSAKEALKNLLDPKIANKAVGFSREFALVRGPIGMIFVAYKTDVIGVLPDNDFSELRLGRDFKHVREAVQELGLFSKIA